jgi:hypothetical protein
MIFGRARRLSLRRSSASIRDCSQLRTSLLAVVARLDGELMLAERLGAQGLERSTSAGRRRGSTSSERVCSRSASASAWRCSMRALRARRRAPRCRADLLQRGERARR